MPALATGSASIDIDASPTEVFEVVTDLARMGEWSPESGDVRWLDGADRASDGARFAGDNEVMLGPIPLKRWTTESEVTAFEPGETFEFVSAGYTTWRFEMVALEDGTRLTESYSYPPYSGIKKVSYGLFGYRARQLQSGVEATVAAIKSAVERA